MNETLKKDLDKMLLNKKLASYRVVNWIGTYTKAEICEIIGFSRPTLDLRLKEHNWKHKEIKKILNNLPF